MSKDKILYGLRTIESLLTRQPASIIELFLVAQRPEIIELANNSQLKINYIDKKKLTNLCNTDAHQGIAARVRSSKNLALSEVLAEHNPKNSLFLILDGIQDPHNLGACLRTAQAAGVDAVIVPKDRCCPVTAVVSKVSCGAAEVVPLIQVTNLVRALQLLKQAGIWVVGTEASAQTTIYDVELAGPIAVILGSEGYGLRKLTAQHCDYLASIPIDLATGMASLNVSVATGICLFEVVRQRIYK